MSGVKRPAAPVDGKDPKRRKSDDSKGKPYKPYKPSNTPHDKAQKPKVAETYDSTIPLPPSAAIDTLIPMYTND